MNQRSALIGLLVICGVLVFLLFHGNDYTELVFSKESGFYDEPFHLEMFAPIGTEIYYTLDGSEPDDDAILYMEPVIIDDATNHENVYSMRTDVVWKGFEESALTYDGKEDPKYVSPDYPVDKCTVVRAAYKDADGNFSEIKSASYFVGYQEKHGYEGVNIISIMTDPDNLFDYETGIYAFPFGVRAIGNFTMKGIEWERSATVCMFNSQKDLFFSKNCGIRIQGRLSRGRLPKSLNLYAREEYSGEGRFYIDLFGTDYMPKTVTLSVSGEDALSKCRDAVTSRLTMNRSFASMHYEPYVMFLDGEYWGFYWLNEKYDNTYFQHYYGVDSDNVVFIKSFTLEEGEESDYELYTEMMDYMEHADLTLPENYQRACELIDMQSYIDYYAVETYIGHNHDWPLYNEGLWRVRQPEANMYGDGKWRWVLYDVNAALFFPERDTLAETMNDSIMFYNLCQNEEFKKQFTITFMDIVNSTFSKAHVESVIAECVNQMANPMRVHLKRFFSFEDNGRFLEEVETIRSFFDNRKPYITQYLKNDIKLTGILAPVTVEINDLSAGNVSINTIDSVFDETCCWNGEYYTDYPITLSVDANEGYRFVRWEKDIFSENDSIVVSLTDEGIHLKAVFEKMSE